MRQVRTIELIPGRLSARVFAGQAPGGKDVWCYASAGLERVGQREIVLQIARHRGDTEDASNTPDFPFWVMRQAHREAEAGKPLDAGARLAVPGSEAGHGITGFLLEEHPDAAPLYPDSATPILAVPLVGDEYQVADVYGHARLLALLGAQERLFPYPAYFTRRRKSVVDYEKLRAATVLARMAMTHTPWIEVAGSGTELRVTVLPERAGWFAWLLREHGPRGITVLTAATHSTAAHRYIWTRDGAPSAIGVNGIPIAGNSLVAGNFLVLVVTDGQSSTNRMEDGFGLVLSPADRDQISAALESGREYRHRTGPADLVIGTGSIGHDSPFGAYAAPDTFRRHEPPTAAAAPAHAGPPPEPSSSHPDSAPTKRRGFWSRSDRAAGPQPSLPPPPPLHHPDAPARFHAHPDSRPYWQGPQPPAHTSGPELGALPPWLPPAPAPAPQPDPAQRYAPRAVELKQIVLVSEEAAFAAEMPMDRMAAFCDEITRIVDEGVAAATGHDLDELVVGVEFAPERPLQVSLATKGSFPKPSAQALVNRLDGLNPPPVRERVLAFEVWFRARA
ncbi:hypothetical protein [Nocardia huaxiensis]|uniref:hypothetical protein n=1 Tax=Nocardia huaxiensis TaxID=2755382 RepID=UPI001E3140DF|nr:hypothetical protein [Nocardia huaxiensis]UFS97344.1 hypothetical protein LPY97_05350 [Nocardia huaxiensis]